MIYRNVLQTAVLAASVYILTPSSNTEIKIILKSKPKANAILLLFFSFELVIFTWLKSLKKNGPYNGFLCYKMGVASWFTQASIAKIIYDTLILLYLLNKSWHIKYNFALFC